MNTPLEQGQQDELAAWTDMAAAAPMAWAQAHGLAAPRRGASLAISLRDLPAGMFNRCFGMGRDAPLTDEDIDWAMESVPHHPVWLQPTPGGHEAGSMEQLARRGFTQLPMRWGKLARSLLDPIDTRSHTGFTVRELAREEGDVFGRTLAEAMGLPPWMGEWSPLLAGRPGWHLYAAFDEGRAIGCAALFMNGASSWLGMAATRAEARNRGVQRALMLRRLADARERGAVMATTETGEPMPGQLSPSFHNMLGCGFRVSGYRTNWKAPAKSS